MFPIVFGPPPAHLSKLKQHGFARTSIWKYNQSESSENEDGIIAIFNLSHSTSTLELYPSEFNLTYSVHLTSSNLSMSLNVVSPSSATAPSEFQALLHSYIRLPNSILPPQVSVTPLGGLIYVDKVQGGARSKEDRAVVNFDGPKGEIDRVVLDAPNVLELNFGGVGRMEMTKKGLSDVVVRLFQYLLRYLSLTL